MRSDGARVDRSLHRAGAASRYSAVSGSPLTTTLLDWLRFSFTTSEPSHE